MLFDSMTVFAKAAASLASVRTRRATGDITTIRESTVTTEAARFFPWRACPSRRLNGRARLENHAASTSGSHKG